MTDDLLKQLARCPFCGAGETRIDETRLSPRIDGKEPALISVVIRHWCQHPSFAGHHSIEVRGRDHGSAINSWNRRAMNHD